MKRLYIILGAIITVILIVFHIKNMMVPIFYIGADIYRKESQTGNLSTYYLKDSGKSVKITDKGELREIEIDNKIFRIYGQPSGSANPKESEMLTIEYPDGKIVKGNYDNNLGIFFYKSNEGKLEPELPEPVVTFSTGQKISNEDVSKIKNGTIVTMAFESLQSTNGDPSMFIPGFIILIAGIISLKFPKFLFNLRYSLWVENPEPSGLYLMVTKVGGIASCILGAALIIFCVEVF